MESIKELFNLPKDYTTPALDLLVTGESRYLRDLKMNFKTILKGEHLSAKEISLLGVSVAANDKNDLLLNFFTAKSKENEASDVEIGEAVACASLLSSNNILYRFRHFADNEKYSQLPARMRMNVMMNPVLGKEFFELVSLAISAVNGCELCVNAHEKSLIELGTKEERIFESIRISSVITSVSKVFY